MRDARGSGGCGVMNPNRVIRCCNRRTRRQGMTLVEVMIASSIIFLVSGALIVTIVTGSRLSYASAQHVAAFGLCKDRLEQMRGMEFTDITSAAFPTETITLTHAGGSLQTAIACTRSTTVVDQTNPMRKDVSIVVAWTYATKSLTERIDTTLYLKE
jgi:Tfp pilus assembly protein PilV